MKATTKRRTLHILTASVLGLGMLSLVPVAAQAWGRGGRGHPSPDRAVERLTEELTLTADQQQQVKAILEQEFAKREELRATHRKEMDALRDETHKSLTDVLSPDQVQKLDQLREERRDRMEHWRDCGRGHGPRGEGRPSDD